MNIKNLLNVTRYLSTKISFRLTLSKPDFSSILDKYNYRTLFVENLKLVFLKVKARSLSVLFKPIRLLRSYLKTSFVTSDSKLLKMLKRIRIKVKSRVGRRHSYLEISLLTRVAQFSLSMVYLVVEVCLLYLWSRVAFPIGLIKALLKMFLTILHSLVSCVYRGFKIVLYIEYTIFRLVCGFIFIIKQAAPVFIYIVVKVFRILMYFFFKFLNLLLKCIRGLCLIPFHVVDFLYKVFFI
jgi:hypothetical protein